MYIIGIDLGGTKIEAILVKNDILQPIKKKRIPEQKVSKVTMLSCKKRL